MESKRLEGGLLIQGAFHVRATKGNPLVSIITVVRNGEKHLEETIQSVLNQTYKNIEYIILDAVSTDRTLEIIRKNENSIAYWISEPDKGIYYAMNKGIEICNGSIIGILNSDDWYLPRAVFESVQAIQKTGASFSYGKAYLAKENGEIFGNTRPLNNKEMSRRIFREMPFAHISAFVTKNLYEKIGVFDTSYNLSADYEFFLKAHTKGAVGANTDDFVGVFRSGGQSGGIQTFKESRKIILKYGKGVFYANYIFCCSLLKIALIKILPPTITKIIKKTTKSKHNLF